MWGFRSADISATCGGSPSNTSRERSRKSSAVLYESGERQIYKPIRSPRGAEGRLTRDLVDIKSEILSKPEGFLVRPNSRGLNLGECLESVGVGRINADAKNSENMGENIEEIFIHNQFFTSSSESERVRISSEELQDEVFSTGISDAEQVDHQDIKQKYEKRAAALSRGSTDKTGLPQWLTTKSIVKNTDERTERRAAHGSPNRMNSPVQRRLSLRTMKTPPCFCLLDEIRKNNLVMKEDIYSSSSHKVHEFLATQTQNAGRSGSNNNSNSKKSSDLEITNNLSNERRNLTGITAGKTDFSQRLMITKEIVEVYETTGENNGVGKKAKRNQRPRFRQDSVTSDVNALAVDITYDRNRFKDFWRPFNAPNQNYGSERSNEGIQPTKRTISPNPEEQSVIQINEDPTPLLASANTPYQNHLTNGYRETKPSTPNRRPERYVKLPGLLEAFSQQNSNFKDLRIKDGTSFLSVNALKKIPTKNVTANQKNTLEFNDMSMNNVANQNREPNDFDKLSMEKQVPIQNNRRTETKDAATNIRIPLIDTKTQTGNVDKTTMDCSVQCESHVVDEANGRNATKNNHQEIMVCNDNGDGVQLYNELGHPLTDMDGYLLKDSLGRFLVRLDHFGIPISCTNGQAIFMEDYSPWDAVKNNMSIIHQSRKKTLKSDNGVKKGKGRSSLHHLETAMKNLKNTLGLANNVSLDTSHESILERLTYLDEGKRCRHRKKTALDANKSNNYTTSLIAEMKSIARLRNALLEKVNFIAYNRNKLGELGKNHASLGTKKSCNEPYNKNWLGDPTSILARQERPFSPTYQAMKKLAENEEMKEAEDLMNFSGAGITPNHTTGYKPYGNTKNVVLDLWMDPVNAKSFGDHLPKEKNSGRNQLKTVSWINALPGNSLNTNSSIFKKADENEVKVKDLWNLIKDTSKDKFNTSMIDADCNDKLKISQADGYEETDKDLERLDMRIVNKGIENLTDISGLKQVPLKDLAFTGSQLLISLEKQYNLRKEKSWFEIFEPPISRRRYETMQDRRRSEMRPSIEFSSSSSNNF